MAEEKTKSTSKESQLTVEEFVNGAPLRERDKHAAKKVLRSKFGDKKKSRSSWVKEMESVGIHLIKK